MITKEAKLYLGAPNGITPPLRISQYDTTWRWRFTIYDGDDVWTPPIGTVALFEGRKPDGTVVTANGTINDTNVIVDCTEQISSASGTIECELRFSDDDKIVGTANFQVKVEAAPLAGHTASNDDFSAVDQILTKITAQAQRIERVGGIVGEIEQLKALVGSPLVATAKADMTNTSKVYVYQSTPAETGMTNGNWYYYDGDNWVSGGVYNAETITTDATLTTAGMAADAKAVGDKFVNAFRYHTTLTSEDDLDELQSPGIYRWTLSAHPLHSPTSPGIMLYFGPTDPTTGTVAQMVISNYEDVWIRWKTSTGWRDWSALAKKSEAMSYIGVIDSEFNLDTLSERGVCYARWVNGAIPQNSPVLRGGLVLNFGPANAVSYIWQIVIDVTHNMYTRWLSASSGWSEWAFLSGGVEIDDSATSSATTWSSAKITREIVLGGGGGGGTVNHAGTKIAFLGDSITSGRVGGQESGSRPSFTIPQRVASELGIKTENYGVGGMGWRSTANYDVIAPDYIRTLDLSDYNYIFMMYGTNDSAADLGTYTDTASNNTIMGAIYDTMVYLSQTYPTTALILATPPLSKSGGTFPAWGDGINRGPSDGTRWKMPDLREQYGLFAERYHLMFVDTSGAINSWNIDSLIGDSVHPTEEGYQILGKYIAGQIGALI